MNAGAALAGVLRIRPGRPPPNIESTRTTWAAIIARGKSASELPDLLGRIFALCGGAHRTASRLALAAACGGQRVEYDDARVLQADTLVEQLRRIWIDWPEALAAAPASAAESAALRACPLMRRAVPAESALRAMPDWLAEHALGVAAQTWLDRWRADPEQWLAAWSAASTALPARLLKGCRDAASHVAAQAPQALSIHLDPAALSAQAAALRADRKYALKPCYQGRAVETGPWTRTNDSDPSRYRNAWLRLGARLADTVRLALPDEPQHSGAGWLRHGSQPLQPGEGLGWCEMARGLLVHRVEVDDPGAADPRVVSCDVLAPTEWNFHPAGPVAQAIAGLTPDADGPARLIAAAYDPCVAIEREAPNA